MRIMINTKSPLQRNSEVLILKSVVDVVVSLF